MKRQERIEMLVRDAQRDNREQRQAKYAMSLSCGVSEVHLDGETVAIMASNGKWYALGPEVKPR